MRAGLVPAKCMSVASGSAGDDIRRMKAYRMLGCALVIAAVSPHIAHSQGSYLFVWAGGKGGKEIIATIDATPTSATYGRVLATASTGTVGFPHHTESELGTNGHLLANDFDAG